MKKIASIKILATVFTALILSSGCINKSDSDGKASYVIKPPIPLNAREVIIKYDYNPTLKSPGTDHLFSKALVQNIEEWVYTRLQPAGLHSVAYVTVRDASVVNKPSQKNPERLEGKIELTVSIINANGVVIAQGEAKVRGDIEIPGNMTGEERQNLTHILAIKLIDALDIEMEQAISKFSGF